ncbi:unnamed protein product [Caenorhabditis auriculariae]|uniref:Uncharacterized protein n=1 Tax=Caenorhabditis auriculariae TaxID=2777116 RepID=A0A8S1GVZ6_9PELO|nr:unnamed protein product [Caenorhabditis auriculariae]
MKRRIIAKTAPDPLSSAKLEKGRMRRGGAEQEAMRQQLTALWQLTTFHPPKKLETETPQSREARQSEGIQPRASPSATSK